MGFLKTLFPITPPPLRKLPEDELSWPMVKTSAVPIPTVAAPQLSADCAIVRAVVNEIAVLPKPNAPQVDVDFTSPSLLDAYNLVLDKPDIKQVDLNHLEASLQIVDLLSPLAKPGVNGTIFIKKEGEQLHLGQKQPKTTIEPLRLQAKLNPKQPKGLDIFEMLLPVLMPPLATEFRDELLFPQELYPYQRLGVKWLFEKESALLADDMGLGKTVQAITAFRALIRKGKASQALVICPKSVLTNWMRELKKWAPELVAVQVHGNPQTRKVAWHGLIGKCHVLVTTYETIRQDHETILGRAFDLVVVDEAQRIKNADTDTSRAMRSVNAQRRWGLTGTPMENDLEDIVSIFGFIKPGLFRPSELPSLSSRSVRERIKPYLLRRRKEDALPDLPAKKIDTKWLELTESQRRTYDLAENEGVVSLRENREVTIQHVLALITKLKQICNFDKENGDSAKLDFLQEEFLENACKEESKALIFSQYVKTLEELEKHLKDYKPLVFKGELTMAQRDKIVEAFSSKDEHKILLLSLKAGGLGLNLTAANYVLHFDRWWNPAVESQAEGRTHRIGQLKTVFVTRLICQNTIEERIDLKLEGKRIRFHEVVDELADVNLERVLSEEELFGLFGLKPPRRSREAPQEQAPVGVAQAPATGQQTSKEIKSETPYSNVLHLRQILRRCEQYVWWADRYFSQRGLEELVYTIDPAIVREVRILSGPDNVDEQSKREFRRFKEEMERKGVSAEWRVLKGFAHDRFIISESTCFIVPSIDTILRGQYSQIVETSNRPPFDSWWKEATPIALYVITNV